MISYEKNPPGGGKFFRVRYNESITRFSEVITGLNCVITRLNRVIAGLTRVKPLAVITRNLPRFKHKLYFLGGAERLAETEPGTAGPPN